MKHDQLQRPYTEFFNSEAGQYFLQVVNDLHDRHFDTAEKSTDMPTSFAHVHKASGNTEVLDHIQSVINNARKEPKK